ncbi:methionine-R-sulfoxide reductase B3 isoform X3 [Ochotona curzoniae]|uniref:methionine-R-sulfoxide reductase B3 isoform X3 n=1 Tax=Ochotona curzoniae TaxID=130825 RepID=UPI001B350A03|nr:methionine-R-sulfoxide reductase B3 isoform X3 [Ochotona curzoniae]XP_040838285.1 methionine-R-sulfoxide reductase B3 isoform X3 [Ochotona curzoniae]XP_040838292.1 methionine-R-sulfoxide reductase B3 isoform X3 [Ochotona curzoniae]
MSLRRKGLKVPLKENTHITKILEYTNVLFVELHCSTQKPSMTLAQVGLHSMMRSVPSSLRSQMTSPTGCTGWKPAALRQKPQIRSLMQYLLFFTLVATSCKIITQNYAGFLTHSNRGWKFVVVEGELGEEKRYEELRISIFTLKSSHLNERFEKKKSRHEAILKI